MMPPTRFASWGITSFVLIYWISVNDAIPHGSYANKKIRPSALRQSEYFTSRRSHRPVTAQWDPINSASMLETPVVSSEDEEPNYNFNSNINVNEVYFHDLRPISKKPDPRQTEFINYDDSDYSIGSAEKFNASPNILKVPEHHELDIPMNVTNTERKKKVRDRCGISGRRSSQAYSRSFPGNESSMAVVDVFEVAGDAEAKKTSSVHVGKDITLCWIETTTIKEDPVFDPPKRLVIREFTISFENSAMIPEDNIECAKLDGEIPLGDDKTVCGTSLSEVIDEDTTRSRVVNFTKDSRDGSINIRRQKTVKCAMGGVVVKDIYEFPDNSDNPKKRVEIKVGPTMRNVRTGSETEPGVCPFKADAPKSQERLSTSAPPGCASGENCGISPACTDSKECNQPNTLSSCEDDDCPITSSEESLPTAHQPNPQKDTLDELTQPTAAEEPDETAIFTASLHNSETAIPLDGPTDRTPTNDAELCSGGDCQEESAVNVGLEQKDITCEESSEPCPCTGPSCSFHSIEDSSTPEIENQVAGKITASSINASPNMILNDYPCDSASSECLGSTETSREQIAASTVPSVPSGTGISEYPTNDEKQTPPKSSQIEFTVTPTELTPPSSILMSNEIPSSTAIPPRLESQPDFERSSSCGDDSTGENCQSTGSVNGSELKDDYATTETISGLTDTTLSSAPKESTPIVTAVSETPSAEVSTESPLEIRRTTLPTEDSSLLKDSVTECNSLENCVSTEGSLTSTTSSLQITTNSTTPVKSGAGSSCSDSGESCGSSTGSSSENCDNSPSSGDCTGSGPEPCESTSGSCSSESDSSIGLKNETKTTTTTEPTAKEVEDFSTIVDNVSTTAETRRSTTTTEPKLQHKLALKIRVLLERINEKKEKEKLVQLEKHLLFNERPEEKGNHSLVWQIKSLNNSMNIETLKSIFNCTELDNLTEEFSHFTEFQPKGERRMYWGNMASGRSWRTLEKSPPKPETEIGDNDERESKKISFRKKREISVVKGHVEEGKNMTNAMKVQAVKEGLSGLKEDFQRGLGQVLHRISRELDGPARIAANRPVESSSSTILNILANPNDGRVHSRRRKRATSQQEVVSVEDLRFPINGETIHRWSNERFVRAADGGGVRSLLEFKIMRGASDDSPRRSSGS